MEHRLRLRAVLSLLLPILLAAGLVGVLAVASPARAAAVPSYLRAPATLASGQRIVSGNGNFDLIMQTDGNLVLYTRFGYPLWNTHTARNPGSRLAVQTDGNLVIYTPANRAIWQSRTRGRGGVLLTMQSDGNLVLYTAASRPVWYTGTRQALGSAFNPSAGGSLFSGATMTGGTALVSPNGSYRAAMQTDGNFVVYGPSNRVLWTTRSSGWGGDRMVLQGDGNLVLYTSGGYPLWNARTRNSGAVELLMGNDGDLRLYTASGALRWQSAGAPLPMIFPPATSPPPTSTSRYPRDLNGVASHDVPLMQARGCTDARNNPPGHPYLGILDIGAQFSPNPNSNNPAGTWSVLLSATSNMWLTNAQLVTAIKGYLDGYASCMASYSLFTLAVATNNDSGQYAVQNACGYPPAGQPDPLGAAGGQVWAQQVINPLQSYAAGKGQITIAGGNDIEPGFEGCPDQATAWIKAYLAATGQPYVFIGSADGCPPSSGCQWPQTFLYQVAYGYAGARAIPVPQVYNATMAQQWAYISAAGVAQRWRPIQFGGALTQYTVCRQVACPVGTTLGEPWAWDDLWHDVNANPATRIGGMPYATDLRIN